MSDAHEKNCEGEGEGGGLPFFANRDCAYFPCHEGVAPEDFNCMFCYCPLYVLGDDCGGNPRRTEAGVKDCSACAVPHERDAGTRLVSERFDDIMRIAASV